MITQVTG